MNLQDMINSQPPSGRLKLLPGEFFEQVVIDRPMTIMGAGKGTWIGSRTPPTIKITSVGVKLVNMMVEITTDRQLIAIEAMSGTNPVLEDVIVRGRVTGVRPEDILRAKPKTRRGQEKKPPAQSAKKLPKVVSSAKARLSSIRRPTAAKRARSPSSSPGAAPLRPVTHKTAVGGKSAPSIDRSAKLIVLAGVLGISVFTLVVVMLYVQTPSKKKHDVQKQVQQTVTKTTTVPAQKQKTPTKTTTPPAQKQQTPSRPTPPRDYEKERKEAEEKVRENIRGRLKYISKCITRDKHRMRARYGIVYGNVKQGHWSWVSNRNGRKAVTLAEAGCRKRGGGCARLYNIHVRNAGPDRITIYLYHPWETDREKSNALWQWTWNRRHASNLGVEGRNLFVSNDFYLHAEAEGGGAWGPKRIHEYNTAVRNYRDGQSLAIKLVD